MPMPACNFQKILMKGQIIVKILQLKKLIGTHSLFLHDLTEILLDFEMLVMYMYKYAVKKLYKNSIYTELQTF